MLKAYVNKTFILASPINPNDSPQTRPYSQQYIA